MFQLRKLGHVVLNVTDLEASVRFYTDVLGLSISDRYPDSMVPGGMVFFASTPTITASRSSAARRSSGARR